MRTYSALVKPPGLEQGLFMMETMITLLTIVLALLALGHLQAEIVTGAAMARHRDRAQGLALDRIEDMRFVSMGGYSRSGPARLGSKLLGPPGSGASDERADLDRIYDIRWEARFLGPWREGLRVEVEWQEPGVGKQSLGIETRVCLIPRYVSLGAKGANSLGWLYQAKTGR